MRKRLLLLGSLIAVVLLGAYVILWKTAPADHATLENFERINSAMTDGQVEAVLGQPGAPFETYKLWWSDLLRSGEAHIRSYDFGPNQTSLRSKTWKGYDCLITVGFNDQGQVAQKTIVRSLADQSLLAKLRRWLGL